MPRISQLPSLTTADNADEIAIVDTSASTTKKITRGDLLKAPLPANSVNGQAIADGSVTKQKVAFDSGIWWEEIGRTELTTSNATIVVPLSQSKKVMQIIVCTVGSGGTVRQGLRFNGDAGNNYATRTSNDGGQDQANTSQNNITLDPGATVDNVFSNVFITTRTDASYWSMEYSSVNAAGVSASNVPTRRNGVAKWVTPAPITSINLINNGGTGSFGAGSYIIVLGHN